MAWSTRSRESLKEAIIGLTGSTRQHLIVGFLLAAYSVVANDCPDPRHHSPTANAHKAGADAAHLLGDLCVLLLGWFLNNGDPTWGRLSVPGKEFPWPEPFTRVYVLPPLAVVALTQWGAPHTSFLVLSSFMPSNIGTLLSSSTGYGLVGLAAYGLGQLERWVFCRSQDGKPSKIWWPAVVFHRLSGACGWCRTGQHLCVQAAPVGLRPDAHCTLVLCVGLCVPWPLGVAIQACSTQDQHVDLRSATLIDLLFGLCLLYKAFLSASPQHHLGVFGLIGGRELALRIKQHIRGRLPTGKRQS